MAGKKGSYETLIKISGKVDQSFKGAIDQAERELKGLYQQSKRQNSMMTGIDGLSSLSDQTFRLVEKSAQTAAFRRFRIPAPRTRRRNRLRRLVKSVPGICIMPAGLCG